MPPVETCYDILGVAPDATPDEIRAAYRRLARQYHPDVNPDPDASERFIAIHQAYEVLIDPEARVRYDLSLRHQAADAGGQAAWAPGFTWRAQAPGSEAGRPGTIAALAIWGMMVLLMLVLSLLLRLVIGGRQR